jgi:hypothetical protein
VTKDHSEESTNYWETRYSLEIGCKSFGVVVPLNVQIPIHNVCRPSYSSVDFEVVLTLLETLLCCTYSCIGSVPTAPVGSIAVSRDGHPSPVGTKTA